MQGGILIPRRHRQGKHHCAKRIEKDFRGHHMENSLIIRFPRKISALLRLHLKARTSEKFLISILIRNFV